MNRALLVLLALCLLVLNGCQSVSQPDQDARAAAVEWLALVDSGDFHKAYNDRPPRILAGSKEDEFVRFMQGRRAPLGKPLSRAFYRVSYSKTLVGAPDGDYGFMIFKTKFAHKALAYERVTVTGETGRWQVSGYGLH